MEFIIIYLLCYLASFRCLVEAHHQEHNVTLFVRDRLPGSRNCKFIAIGANDFQTTYLYSSAISYWESLYSNIKTNMKEKTVVSYTLIDECYDKYCQEVVVVLSSNGIKNYQIKTQKFSRNVTGHTFSQLVKPAYLASSYTDQSTTLPASKHLISSLLNYMLRNIMDLRLYVQNSSFIRHFTSGYSLEIDNVILNQYPGWMLFISRIDAQKSDPNILPFKELACVAKIEIEAKNNSYKSAMCVHAQNSNGLNLNMRLVKENSGTAAHPWSLPCPTIDNRRDLALKCWT
ncbi:similar to Saccharomyces cerevisiae YER076C Putative protein of unknown function [Maudiozyma saulgeensis]|uniref:Uncharacterized protein n=1 Tax=Maudiozyma saulgeensis TaxID=1789683 RepID=A0A1X7R5G5_9SACH|nr:similar to Saccharomyces cerevisiae YER076C Putative protein of unknown function [Kazachstania saulgeensis]